MSIRAIDTVWKTSKQKGSALLLLLAIADYAKDDGSGAWPSLQTLADKTRMGKRNVIKLVQKLEKAGELQVKRGQGPNGTNFYDILFPQVMNPSSPPPKMASEPQFTPPVNPSSPALVNPSSPKPSKEPSKEPSSTTVSNITTNGDKPKTLIKDKFLELTKLKMPTNKQAGFWWSKFQELLEIGETAERTNRIQEYVICYMLEANLTITGPQSIVNLCRARAAGQEFRNGNNRNNGHNRIPSAATDKSTVERGRKLKEAFDARKA